MTAINRITCGLLLLALPLAAQPTQEKRTCRILSLESADAAPPEVYLFDGTESRKVELPTMNFGKVIELPPGKLTVGMSSHRVSESAPLPAEAPKAEIMESQTDVYLVVMSDPSNELLPIRLLLLDASDPVLQRGQTLWVNLSKQPITATLGEQEVLMPAMENTVSRAPLPKSGYFLAAFLHQPEGSDEPLPIMKKSWWFDASSKNLGFVINSGARTPKIFTIRDRR